MHKMSRPLLRPLMPELNSLRGLACLAVLFFHGLWWYIPRSASGLEGILRDSTAGGYRGVNLFFVLSGLLITNILLESRDRPDYFARFYKRRVLRILPPYYMMLILLAIYGVNWSFLGISLLHAANMAPTFGIFMAYGPLWSLGVEEQFYFLWPLLVRKFQTKILVFVAVGLFVNNIVLAMGLHTNSPQAAFPLWYSVHGLALGALLAIFLRSKCGTRRAAAWVASAVAIAGFGILLLSFLRWHSWRAQLTGVLNGTAWDVLFTALLLFALLAGSSRFEAWTRPKALLFFGEISYGLYLVHVLVFVTYRRVFHPGVDLHAILAEFVVCCLVSIGLATASRFTIEAWFLRLKDKPLHVWRNRVSSEDLTACEVE